jgi:serine/threonine protein kinase
LLISQQQQQYSSSSNHSNKHLLLWLMMGACGSTAASSAGAIDNNITKVFQNQNRTKMMEGNNTGLSTATVKRIVSVNVNSCVDVNDVDSKECEGATSRHDENAHRRPMAQDCHNPMINETTTSRTVSTGQDSSVISAYNERESSRTRTSSGGSHYSTGALSCEGMSETSAAPPTVAVHVMKRATIRRLEQERSKEVLEDKYKVQWNKILGEGAFGAVYLASNFKTGEQVAVKKISKKFTDQKEFQREMDALLCLHARGGHPNICSLQEHFDEGNHYYLVLDLIKGGEMFDHLIQMGAYSEADAARLLREVASALAFCHGIGIVHGDLKPENIMLSTTNCSDSVVKLVDFGGSECEVEVEVLPLQPECDVEQKTASTGTTRPYKMPHGEDRGRTPAYCPPEILRSSNVVVPMGPSMDMWSLGIIMYIMLTGLHPFDLSGRTPDKEVEARILNKQPPPLRNSAITAHLSESAIELIEGLMEWSPTKRMSAMQMLNHAWVKGETASTTKIADSDKKLSTYRRFQSSLERKVFEDIVQWSDDYPEEVMRKTSLVERAFRSLDPQRKGYLTTTDLKRVSSVVSMAPGLTSTAEDENENETNAHINANDAGNEKDTDNAQPLSLSGFSDLLSENMKNRYYEKGCVLYKEGDFGNHMYFINSGSIEVTTKEGTKARRGQGNFFGEGALLHPKMVRSATITCATPVHAIQISREYFEKYLAGSTSGLALNLREKDKTRKRNRAKTILRLQSHLQRKSYQKGEHLFQVGEEGDALYIIEEGAVDVQVDGNVVFHVYEGDVCGEHSLILGRPRNTNAICVSEEGCVALHMPARDFYSLYDSSTGMRDSLRELCLRREFQKALVRKTAKAFHSSDDLNEVFESADEDGDGVINLDELTKLLLSFDHSLSKEEIQDILGSMDLMKKNQISIQEFKYIFANGIDDTSKTTTTGC